MIITEIEARLVTEFAGRSGGNSADGSSGHYATGLFPTIVRMEVFFSYPFEPRRIADGL
jgi:hypothetical protein